MDMTFLMSVVAVIVVMSMLVVISFAVRIIHLARVSVFAIGRSKYSVIACSWTHSKDSSVVIVITLDAFSQLSQPFGTTLGVVESKVSQLRNRNTVSIAFNVSSVTSQASSFWVGSRTKRVALSTSSIRKNVTSITWCTSSRRIPVTAVIIDWHTLSLTVEDVTLRTFNTNLSVPIPLATTYISHLLKRSNFASAGYQSVSFVAGHTSSR